MPEYLAPGVFVEETSFRSRSIQGVGTSTTAFVGPTRKGPLGTPSDVITSFAEFERLYGGLANLDFDGDEPVTNYMAHAAKAFFDNGGSRLYVARTFTPRVIPAESDGDGGGDGDGDGDGGGSDEPAAPRAGGEASVTIMNGETDVGTFRARYPGAGLNGVILTFLKKTPASTMTLNAAPIGSLVATSMPETTEQEGGEGGEGGDDAGEEDMAGTKRFWLKRADGRWVPSPASDGEGDDNAGGDEGDADEAEAEAVGSDQLPAGAELLTFNLEVRPGSENARADFEGSPIIYERLGFGPGHPRRLADVLARVPSSQAQRLAQPYWFDQAEATTAFALHDALFPPVSDPAQDNELQNAFSVIGGNDGAEPLAVDDSNEIVAYEDALRLLEEIDDISIVAAPGHSAVPSAIQGTQNKLISHAERMRYRIAVLDTQKGAGTIDARNVRARVDSTHAALYYPWVMVPNPAARPDDETIPKELALPPSGFVCGIYARNDITRGVWKAPANEVVRGALRFERDITTGEQEVLNPEGVNCLRSFFGRGHRVWGARTVSSDPEWIYVNVRRYFIYLENSIDRSTQWTVFEPNGPRLWSNITDTISSFLFAEWRAGALLGATPEEAFFVRCDRSTMTQADLDNGRLICEIGVAVLKPAEFVIFRIGQKALEAFN